MHIDKIFYINLRHRKDRRVNIEHQCSKFDIPHERFPGRIMSWEECMKMEDRFSDHFNVWKNDPTMRPRVSTGISAVFSHRNLLESIKDSGLDTVCVMEDDIYVQEDVFDHIEPPQDWDMIRDTWYGPSDLEKFDSVHHLSNHSTHFKTHDYCGGAHFYVVKVKNIPKIIWYLDNHNLLDIDATLNTCCLNAYHKKLPVYILHQYGSDVPKDPVDINKIAQYLEPEENVLEDE